MIQKEVEEDLEHDVASEASLVQNGLESMQVVAQEEAEKVTERDAASP